MNCQGQGQGQGTGQGQGHGHGQGQGRGQGRGHGQGQGSGHSKNNHTKSKGVKIMSKPITMKIDEVEYVRKDSIPAIVYDRSEGPWQIGKKYLIRTVTMILHGTLIDVTAQEFVMVGASWIADTGRFSDFVMGNIEPNEVEPFPSNKNVIIGRGSLIDAVQLDGTFNKQK